MVYATSHTAAYVPPNATGGMAMMLVVMFLVGAGLVGGGGFLMTQGRIGTGLVMMIVGAGCWRHWR